MYQQKYSGKLVEYEIEGRDNVNIISLTYEYISETLNEKA